MSSKSDQDNRANQMNPNNDAYYSSRGIGRGGDDDDDGWGGSRCRRSALSVQDISAMTGIQPGPPPPEDQWTRERVFFFDFVDLDGCSRHFQFTSRVVGSILDAEDLAAEWLRSLKSALYPNLMPLAMWRLVDAETGEEKSWTSGRYQAGRVLNWTEDTPEARQALRKNDERWANTGEPAVARLLERSSAVERIDLGTCTSDEMLIGNGGREKLDLKIKQLTRG